MGTLIWSFVLETANYYTIFLHFELIIILGP